MSKRRIDILWAVCLIVPAAAFLVQFGVRLAGGVLPDMAVRLLGVLYIAALPVLAYTTVMKLKQKR